MFGPYIIRYGNKKNCNNNAKFCLFISIPETIFAVETKVKLTPPISKEIHYMKPLLLINLF